MVNLSSIHKCLMSIMIKLVRIRMLIVGQCRLSKILFGSCSLKWTFAAEMRKVVAKSMSTYRESLYGRCMSGVVPMYTASTSKRTARYHLSPSNQYCVGAHASIGWMYLGSLNRLCADVPCLRSLGPLPPSKIPSCSRISPSAIVILLAMPCCFSRPCSSLATEASLET